MSTMKFYQSIWQGVVVGAFLVFEKKALSQAKTNPFSTPRSFGQKDACLWILLFPFYLIFHLSQISLLAQIFNMIWLPAQVFNILKFSFNGIREKGWSNDFEYDRQVETLKAFLIRRYFGSVPHCKPQIWWNFKFGDPMLLAQTHRAHSDSPVLTQTHRAHSDSPCSLRFIVLTQTHRASSRLEPPRKKKRFPKKIEPATWLWARNMTGNAIRMQFCATVLAQWHRAGSIFHEVFVLWVGKFLGEKKLSEQHESEPVTWVWSPQHESEPVTWVWARNMPMLKSSDLDFGDTLESPKIACIFLGVLTPKLHGNQSQLPKYKFDQSLQIWGSNTLWLSLQYQTF